MVIVWYGMVKLYLNTLYIASINVSCFSWGASHNNYLQIKEYIHIKLYIYKLIKLYRKTRKQRIIEKELYKNLTIGAIQRRCSCLTYFSFKRRKGFRIFWILRKMIPLHGTVFFKNSLLGLGVLIQRRTF
jgi:hypothetical protein